MQRVIMVSILTAWFCLITCPGGAFEGAVGTFQISVTVPAIAGVNAPAKDNSSLSSSARHEVRHKEKRDGHMVLVRSLVVR